YVAFNLPDDRVAVKDRDTGELTILAKPDGFNRTSVVAISGDGRSVAFRASTLNVALRGAYVADLDTLETIRMGRNLADDAWESVDPVDLSDDGRFVVLESTSSELVADDVNGMNDIFRFDRNTGAIALVSVA